MKYMLCRTEEKAQRLAKEQGIPTTLSEEACVAADPDFVVVAVTKTFISQVTAHWARKGFPVLCETPAGASVEQLQELWQLHQEGARIQVAEQYHRYPILAAGLREIQAGKIGEPYMARLSVAHDYHGASLLRRMLNLGMEPMKLVGKRYMLSVVQTDSRQGPITDGSVKKQKRDVVAIEYESGKTAFYDFSGVQYQSFIRSRHLNVQGPKGEWNDTLLRYVEPDSNGVWQPAMEQLMPYLNPRYCQLETPYLREAAGRFNSILTLEDEQDDYAIATMMHDMREFVESAAAEAVGEETPSSDGRDSEAVSTWLYPLADALEDAYTWILIREAAEHPGQEIHSEPMPWQESQKK